MNINSFDPKSGKTGQAISVRLSLDALPKYATTSNTKAWIGSLPITVDAVDVEAATISASFTVGTLSQRFLVVVADADEDSAEAESADSFTVEDVNDGRPRIVRINPPSAKRGDRLSLFGQNLDAVSSINIGSYPASAFLVVSATLVNVTVPQAAQPGEQRVSGKTHDGAVIYAPGMLDVLS